MSGDNLFLHNISGFWWFRPQFNIFFPELVQTGLDRFGLVFCGSGPVFWIWQFLGLVTVPVLPKKAKELGPDQTFKHYLCLLQKDRKNHLFKCFFLHELMQFINIYLLLSISIRIGKDIQFSENLELLSFYSSYLLKYDTFRKKKL